MNCTGYEHTNALLKQLRDKKHGVIVVKEVVKKETAIEEIVTSCPLRQIATELWNKLSDIFHVIRGYELEFSELDKTCYGTCELAKKIITIDINKHKSIDGVAFTLCHEIAHAIRNVGGHDESFYSEFGQVIQVLETKKWINFKHFISISYCTRYGADNMARNWDYSFKY